MTPVFSVLCVRHAVGIRDKGERNKPGIVQELCESRGGRPGLSVLTSLLVSVDVKNYWTVLRHWSQLVPNMSNAGHLRTLSINSSSPSSSSSNKPGIVQELYESRGGRPAGLSVLTSLLPVSVDVKIYWTVLRHWSQLVPNMSTDIWGH